MTTNIESLAAGPTAAAGERKLASRVQRLSTRAASGSLDRWLLIVGGVLVPLGVLVVILGWLGASRTPLVFEQVPYLISGGQLGVALVFAGGFVYFAYWQTVRVRDARAHQAELVASLQRIESLLAGGASLPAPGTTRAPAADSLVATSTGTMLHRADCTIVAGRANLRVVTADTPGLEPCKICEPLAVTST